MNIARLRGTASQGTASRLLATVTIAAALLVPPVNASAPSSIGQQGNDCAQPDDVVGKFYRAVEEGGLVVFGQAVSARQLRPVRVEFAHDLKSGVRTVSVHAELLAPITVPNSAGMVARKVAVVMGGDGRIIETQAHVVMR